MVVYHNHADSIAFAIARFSVCAYLIARRQGLSPTQQVEAPETKRVRGQSLTEVRELSPAGSYRSSTPGIADSADRVPDGPGL